MTNEDQQREQAAPLAGAESSDFAARKVRLAAYALLIILSAGNMAGRILSVTAVDVAGIEKMRIRQTVDRQRKRLEQQGVHGKVLREKLHRYADEVRQKVQLQRPFLSANDRSRWCTIRALVDDGTYAIDQIVTDPAEHARWQTIDMVKHDRNGEPHLYSSKPTLLPTLLAGEYWLVQKCTGWTLAKQPFQVVRTMLLCTNVTSMVLLFVLLALLLERFGSSDWGRLLVMATATFGTFLTTFSLALNNHLIAAVCIMIALYAAAKIWYDDRQQWHWFVLAGFFSALAAAVELPSLIFLLLLGLGLLWKSPRCTLLFGVPAVLLVVAAALGTNMLAHRTLLPPYAYRMAGEDWRTGNWYSYRYNVGEQSKSSYWNTDAASMRARSAIDRGESSRRSYAVHCLIGHHGIFSLTPIWLLSLAGVLAMTVRRVTPSLRAVGLLIGVVSVVCFSFYVSLGIEARNYGGMTSGLRWFFWLTPLLLVAMIPAADWSASGRGRRILVAVLLFLSVLSASYPTWNPWTQPWLVHWFAHLGGMQM